MKRLDNIATLNYEFQVAVLDQLLKEKKITHMEWYDLLIKLRHEYNLPCIDNINIVDISTEKRQYTDDGKGSNCSR